MLYIDPFTKQTYTAHQALYNEKIDVIPLRLPQFTSMELEALFACSFSQVSSKILNVFFGISLKSSEIEKCLKDNAFIPDYLDRKTLLIKLIRDEDHGYTKLINDIYCAMTEKSHCASYWARSAISISLIFGIFADLRRCGVQKCDLSLGVNDSNALIPFFYAAKMGAPIQKIILGCSTEEGIWTLLKNSQLRGSYCSALSKLLYAQNPPDSERYARSCAEKQTFFINQEQLLYLNSLMFTTVVSHSRSSELVGNIGSTFGKNVSPACATAYGALQDYRSISGENHITLILTEE